MQLSEEQYKHATSLLSPGSKVLLECLEEALNKEQSSTNAFSLLMDITEKSGGIAYLAIGKKLRAYLRNLTLVDDYQSGMSINQLSKKYNLSHNTVYIVIRKANALKG
ncbi:unknow (plasmid) [Vibrio campbellii]|uniref:Mor transcription activator family protein n=1 Tax=Vibrio campbellii TaxID=680 RepID=UPI000A2FDA50|nr:Mor transcription activator family protein [Vibrio campbellii]ARR08602.1 unknow [Vibrio campbellii]ARR10318.1 unknow [Vibrio campbellii]